MAISTFNEDVNIIAALGDNPNTDDGLSAAQLKERFDAAANLIKTYINNTLVPQITAQLQTKLSSSNKLNGSYITDGTIKNAQISSSASIAGSKLASGAALSNIGAGNITATYIGSGEVTYAKLNADAKPVAYGGGSATEITKAKWSAYSGSNPDLANGFEATVTGLTAVTASNNIIVTPGSSATEHSAAIYQARWIEHGVCCIEQGNGYIKLWAEKKPDVVLQVAVLVVR